ncbi:MAG TPA: MmgE/PrpD family protein [Actinomycetota bacterium]
MTIAQDLAAWGLGSIDAPAEVRRAAARHLIDGYGCALAAARRGDMRAAVRLAVADAGDDAGVIGSDARAAAPVAALANGALVHALDYDDTHTEALVHATAAVLPTVLAVGEETGASHEAMLGAAIAGYEVVIALGSAVRHGFHARGFHATSVCGVFASALIAARLYGLRESRAVDALGIAGSMAAGSLEFLSTGSSTKQLHPGIAGMNGITAARLAGAGAEGPASIIEGEHGLFRLYAGATVESLSPLGSTWETTRITIKPYPACQLSHASLDALLAAGVPADDVASLTFELPADSIAIVCEPAEVKRAPRTPYEGKFSLPYCAAALLLDGGLTLESFDPAALARAGVLQLAEGVSARPRLFDGAPADAPGIVEARMLDGQIVRAEVPTSRGGPSHPLTDDELLTKFEANAGGTEAGPLVAFLLSVL